MKRIFFIVFALIFAFSAVFSADALIVIDAGHGGEDGGAVTADGVPESGINLDISLKLEQILALLGYETRMTRRTSDSLATEGKTLRARKSSDLKNRVKIIEEAGPELLISIHQNKFPQKKYYGAQVFFSAVDPVGAELAVYVQENLRLALDPSNSRQAAVISDSVYLMKSIDCPAILVECGFLSNPREAERLCDPQYQLDIAAAIAAAAANYMQKDG